MIYFFADNHYNTRAGFYLYDKINPTPRKSPADRAGINSAPGREQIRKFFKGGSTNDFPIKFFEDDISVLAGKEFLRNCSLLIVNLICGTGSLGMPGEEIEVPLKEYCMRGRPLFLVHAGSAAFWHWEWWRKLTGLRWVRENNPEGKEPSVHPVKDFLVVPAKSSHTIVKELKSFELKNDEIYTKLEKTQPVDVLMETTIDEGTFPMAFVSKNEWGGKVLGFLPGHKPESFENKELIHDVKTIIKYALEEK